MHIQNATILVTGANRGLGAEFARQALARGAKKVYAAARVPESVTLEGVVPVRLDVTDAAAVAALAAELGDVDLVINNAGVAGVGKLLAQGTQVLGVHVGMIDTDLTRGFDLPKLGPDTVVARSFAALEAGAGEVLVDEITRAVKQGLIAEPPLYTLA